MREADRVTVDNWDDHIRIGTERMGAVDFGEGGAYDRYNPPSGA